MALEKPTHAFQDCLNPFRFILRRQTNFVEQYTVELVVQRNKLEEIMHNNILRNRK